MGLGKSTPTHAIHIGAWVELGAVLAAAPFLLLPGRLVSLAWHPAIVGVLLLLRLSNLARRRGPWLMTPLDLAVWLLTLTVPLGLFVSIDRATSWEAAGYILFGVALFFALSNWPPAQRRPILDFALLALAGSLLLGVGIGAASHTADILRGDPVPIFAGYLPPVVMAFTARLGEVVNVNIVLSVAAFMWPFALAFALVWRRDRFWWVPLAGVAGAGILIRLMWLGQSRGSLFAMAAATVVVVVVRWPRLLYLAAVLLPLAGVVAVQTLTVEELQADIYRMLSVGGLSGRQEIWPRAWAALNDFGYTGIGLGQFGKAIPILYPYGVLQEVLFPHAHNMLLQVGLDLGIIGLVAYLSLWIIIVILLAVTLATVHDPTPFALSIGALGATVALLVNGLVDAGMWGTKLSFLPWVLFALVAHLAARRPPAPSQG